MRIASSLLVASSLLLACNHSKEPQSPPDPTTSSATEPVNGAAKATTAAAPTEHAEIGKPAPDFTLKDLDGKEVRLSSFKGKTVVLEWFNPNCPFVKAAHTKGSLKDAASRQTKAGVVWL